MRLTVRDLACRRGGRRVFAGLGFTLEPGDALLVTGRNGAGKSTLLAVLAGLLRPERGTVAVEEAEGRTLAESLHLLGHRDGLKGALSAGENLRVAAALLGAPRLPPAAALDAVGLAGATAIPVARLSAGQRRRVALARLLVAHRPLWLLDEPTTALDAASRDRLLALVDAHRREGGLVVAATHAALPLAAAAELRLAGAAAPGPGS